MKIFFCNRTVDKSEMKRLIKWVLLNYGTQKATCFVDHLKTLGFHAATRAGISLGIDDLRIPPIKSVFLKNAEKDIVENDLRYTRGQITAVEKLEKALDIWNTTNDTLKNEVIDHFRDTDIFNPVYMMAFSGARGNISQVRQLVGMRGLMADQLGQILDFPIRSNFREGLTVTEYMISCYGARKGLVDTALRTANSGYLTRRLVDVAQNVIIQQLDCQTVEGLEVIPSPSHDYANLIGRVLFEPILNTHTGKYMARKNTDISPTLAEYLVTLPKIFVRSPLTCRFNVVCQLCYGWDLSKQQLVQLGEAVGVLAAQSIGEPGTQLTMRTFHTGGVFAGEATEKVYAPHSGIVSYSALPRGYKVNSRYGEPAFLTVAPVAIKIRRKDQSKSIILHFPTSTLLFIYPGQYVMFHQSLAELSRLEPTTQVPGTTKDVTIGEKQLLAPVDGQVYFEQIQLVRKAPKGKPFHTRKWWDDRPGKLRTTFPLEGVDGTLFNMDSYYPQNFKKKKDLEMKEYRQYLKDHRRDVYEQNGFIWIIGGQFLEYNWSSKGDRFNQSFHPFTLTSNYWQDRSTEYGRAGTNYGMTSRETTHKKRRKTQGRAGINYGMTSRTTRETAQKKHRKTQERSSVGRYYSCAMQKLVTYYDQGHVQLQGLFAARPSSMFSYKKNAGMVSISVHSRWSTNRRDETTDMRVKVHRFCDKTRSRRSGLDRRVGKVRHKYPMPRPTSSDLKYSQPFVWETHFTLRFLRMSLGNVCRIGPTMKLKSINDWGRGSSRVHRKKCLCISLQQQSVPRRFKKWSAVTPSGMVHEQLNYSVVPQTPYKHWSTMCQQFPETQMHTSYGEPTFSLQALRARVIFASTAAYVDPHVAVSSRLPAFQKMYTVGTLVVDPSQYTMPFVWETQPSLFVVPVEEGTAADVFVPPAVWKTHASLFVVPVETEIGTNVYPLEAEIRLPKQVAFTKHNQYAFNCEGRKVMVQLGQFIRIGDTLFEGMPSLYSGQLVHIDPTRVILRRVYPYTLSPGSSLFVTQGDFIRRNTLFATLVSLESNAGDIVQGLPKVDELLEAREPPHKILTSVHAQLATLFLFYSKTYGLREGCRRSLRKIRRVLVDEVQAVYGSQGVFISDKHIEIIVRQMTTKVLIIDAGPTNLLPGDIVDLRRVEYLEQDGLFAAVQYRPILLGITRASLASESFISAASFQETKRVLTRAAVEGRIDWLTGLKENVILGRLIPAGTGLYV
jgi:hypothetical protein